MSKNNGPSLIDQKALKVINDFKNNRIAMCKEKEKEFTKLTCESSYGIKTTYEMDSEDPDIEDLMQGFYTLLIGATWSEITILEYMRDFANDKLAVLKKNDDDK